MLRKKQGEDKDKYLNGEATWQTRDKNTDLIHDYAELVNHDGPWLTTRHSIMMMIKSKQIPVLKLKMLTGRCGDRR